jgi:hypothetical protein
MRHSKPIGVDPVTVMINDWRTKLGTTRTKTSLARLNWGILVHVLQGDAISLFLSFAALKFLLLFRGELRSGEAGRTQSRSLGDWAVAINPVLEHDQHQIFLRTVDSIPKLSDAIVRVNVGSVAILELVEPAIGDLFRGVVSFISFFDVLPDVGERFTRTGRDGDDVQWQLRLGFV